MRLLILNQFFYPDISATSQLMTDLAEDLVQRGVKVTVVAGRERYTGGPRLPAEENHRGIRIHRVSSARFDRSTLLRRTLSYVTFYLGALFKLLTLPRQDVVLVLTTPPLISVAACIIKLVRKCSVIYVLQDIYPDVAIKVGILRNNGLVKLLDHISRVTMRYCDILVVLGSCMRQRAMQKGIGPHKIQLVQNWADGNQLTSMPREGNPFLREHGLEDKFVVLYSGNLGKAHDLQTILDCAVLLRGHPRVVFVFVGDGTKRMQIDEFARERSLENVRLLPYQERSELSSSLSAANVSLVTLQQGLEGLVVPSKIYGVMAAGRPVIYVGAEDGEAAATVKQAGCGFVIANGDVERMRHAILCLNKDSALAEEMGRKARAFFELNCERRLLTQRYFELITSCKRGARRRLGPRQSENSRPIR